MTTTPAVHNVPLIRTDDTYTPRCVMPEHLVLQPTTRFRHNGRSQYRIALFTSHRHLSEWVGEHSPVSWNHGIRGHLRAQATVISAHRVGPITEAIAVADGDILRTPLGDFRISDTVALHDPVLVAVEEWDAYQLMLDERAAYAEAAQRRAEEYRRETPEQRAARWAREDAEVTC